MSHRIDLKNIHLSHATVRKVLAHKFFEGWKVKGDNYTVQFYDTSEATGLTIIPPGGLHGGDFENETAIVVKPDGTIAYDNYKGRWWSDDLLGKFIACCAASEAKVSLDGMNVKEILNPRTEQKQLVFSFGK